METKEREFGGTVLNGFLFLFINIALTLASVAGIIYGIKLLSDDNMPAAPGGWTLTLSIVLLVVSIIMWCGMIMLEPNEARTAKKVSLRARNLDAEPIKVNDKTGNPIMIGLVLVWKLNDTYKALFEVDTQTMASVAAGQVGTDMRSIMNALERFVRVQSDAALRQVAGQYAYDDEDNQSHELTLRDGGDEINQQLEEKLNERLALAGIEVVEARINYLAYAPEIAAVMLRRQQASAIITAREKIVEGAVSMVKMALDKLATENIVELDDDKKAAMVSNLLVVLCGDDSAQPVVNTGTLNH